MIYIILSSGNCILYELNYPNKDGIELSCKYYSGKKRIGINLEVSFEIDM